MYVLWPDVPLGFHQSADAVFSDMDGSSTYGGLPFDRNGRLYDE
jgi:hypothetical protein